VTRDVFTLKIFRSRRLLEWGEEKFKNITDTLLTDGQTFGENNILKVRMSRAVAVNTIIVVSECLFITKKFNFPQ